MDFLISVSSMDAGRLCLWPSPTRTPAPSLAQPHSMGMTMTTMMLALKGAIGGCTDYEGDRQTEGLGAGCPGACCFVICPPICPPLPGSVEERAWGTTHPIGLASLNMHYPFRSRLGIFELKWHIKTSQLLTGTGKPGFFTPLMLLPAHGFLHLPRLPGLSP